MFQTIDQGIYHGIYQHINYTIRKSDRADILLYFLPPRPGAWSGILTLHNEQLLGS